MLRAMNYCRRSTVLWTFLLSLASIGLTPRLVCAADKKPLLLDVLLPEDAQLEVNGQKTKSTGETRQFQSAPMTTGRTYAYTLKVVWREYTLTRRVELQPDKLKTLDLRGEIQALATPKPESSFVLLVPPALTLTVDQNAVLPLRVKRIHFPDPIQITFAGLPKGITIPEVTFSEDQSEGRANSSVAADAVPGTHEIHVLAHSGSMKDESTLKITIVGAEKKTERKPEKKPPQSSEPSLPLQPMPLPTPKPDLKLSLVTPQRPTLRAGQSRYVEIKVTAENGSPFSAEPVVALASPPESKLTSAVWTIFDSKNNRAACTVGFAIRAASDAPPGEQKMRVRASAGKAKTEHTFAFLVEPLERKPKPAARPAPVLQLVLPDGVALAAGQTKYVAVQVKTGDDSPLSAEPKVTLETPPKARVRAVPWTCSFKTGQSTCTVGLAVTAEVGGSAGDYGARVRAISGRGEAERTLKLTVHE